MTKLWNKQMEDIGLEIEDYQFKHPNVFIPSNLKGIKLHVWLNDNWMGYDANGELWLSGGARVLLALAEPKWYKTIEKVDKKHNKSNSLQLREFLFRQNLLDINLSSLCGKWELLDDNYLKYHNQEAAQAGKKKNKIDEVFL